MAGRGQRYLRREELDIACLERNGVVSIDIAGCFKAEDVVEIDPLCAPVNVGEVIGPGEAGVVLLEVGLFQKGVGLLDGGDIVSAERFEEAILMGTVGAFDAALGLGRARMDHIDPQS